MRIDSDQLSAKGLGVWRSDTWDAVLAPLPVTHARAPAGVKWPDSLNGHAAGAASA